MRKPRSSKQPREIECVLHPIKVKQVTAAYMQRTMADKGETVLAGYVAEENTIYLAKDRQEDILIHDTLHELWHGFEEHTARMDSEGKADSFAAMVMRIFKPTRLEDLLKKPDGN